MTASSRTIFLGQDAPDAFDEYWDKTPSIAVIEAAFQARWNAEGIHRTFSLPADYLTRDPRDQMVVLFNLEREAAGLSPVQRSHGALQTTIEKPVKAQDFSHATFRGRFDNDPKLKGKDSGEIIALTYMGGAADAVFAWMYRDGHSAWGHRKNILNPTAAWAGIAFGPYNADPQYRGSTYYGVDFGNASYSDSGAPQPAPVTPPPPGPVTPPTPPVTPPGSTSSPFLPAPSSPRGVPAGSASAPGLAGPTPTLTDIQDAFQRQWDTEGIKGRFVLPADFLSKSPREQTIWILNMERAVAGVPPLSASSGALQKAFEGSSAEFATRFNADPELKDKKHTFNATRAASAPAAVFELLYGGAANGWRDRRNLLSKDYSYIGVDRRGTMTSFALVGGAYKEATPSYPGAQAPGNGTTVGGGSGAGAPGASAGASAGAGSAGAGSAGSAGVGSTGPAGGVTTGVPSGGTPNSGSHPSVGVTATTGAGTTGAGTTGATGGHVSSGRPLPRGASTVPSPPPADLRGYAIAPGSDSGSRSIAYEEKPWGWIPVTWWWTPDGGLVRKVDGRLVRQDGSVYTPPTSARPSPVTPPSGGTATSAATGPVSHPARTVVVPEGVPPRTRDASDDGVPPRTRVPSPDEGGVPPRTRVPSPDEGGVPPRTQVMRAPVDGVPTRTRVPSPDEGGVPPRTQVMRAPVDSVPPRTRDASADGVPPRTQRPWVKAAVATALVGAVAAGGVALAANTGLIGGGNPAPTVGGPVSNAVSSGQTQPAVGSAPAQVQSQPAQRSDRSGTGAEPAQGSAGNPGRSGAANGGGSGTAGGSGSGTGSAPAANAGSAPAAGSGSGTSSGTDNAPAAKRPADDGDDDSQPAAVRPDVQDHQ